MELAIDSRQLMYETLQSCRHAWPETERLLTLMLEAMSGIRQTDRLVTTIAAAWLEQLPAHYQTCLPATPETERALLSRLSTPGQEAFTLIGLAGRDALGLWQTGRLTALRHLGYGLHNVPEALRDGGPGRRKDVAVLLPILCAQWDELSLDLRQAVCALQEISLARAQKLARSKRSAPLV